MEEAKWYVVHTYSGYEDKVASTLRTTVENRNLQDYFFDVKVPVEIVEEKTDDGKIKEVKHKIYPGYVFIKMIHTDDTWYVVKSIRGCTGFVGPSSKPVPLSEEEVYRIGVEKRVVKEVDFGPGDQVRILEGPLEDFVGIVQEVDQKNEKVKVTVSMFGRDTMADCDLYQVEKIEEE